MSGEEVGTSACSVRGFYSRKSRQSHQRLRAIFREIRDSVRSWDYNSRVLFGRCTQTPLLPHSSVTANMLFAVFEYKGLWPDNRKMFFYSFVEKTHRSSLTTHCSKAVSDPRLCRRRMCEGRLNTTGSRTRGYSPFRASRPSDATTYLRKRKNVWKTGTWIAGGFQASGL